MTVEICRYCSLTSIIPDLVDALDMLDPLQRCRNPVVFGESMGIFAQRHFLEFPSPNFGQPEQEPGTSYKQWKEQYIYICNIYIYN
jgi:hypothetical protein